MVFKLIPLLNVVVLGETVLILFRSIKLYGIFLTSGLIAENISCYKGSAIEMKTKIVNTQKINNEFN